METSSFGQLQGFVRVADSVIARSRERSMVEDLVEQMLGESIQPNERTLLNVQKILSLSDLEQLRSRTLMRSGGKKSADGGRSRFQ